MRNLYIEEGLFKYLSSYQGLIALVGDRIYPYVMPDGCEKPSITYQRIGTEVVHTMQNDPGLTSPLFQINCWSEDFLDLLKVAKQVKLALQDFSGLMGDIAVQSVSLEDERQEYESDTKLHSIQLDFLIWYIG